MVHSLGLHPSGTLGAPRHLRPNSLNLSHHPLCLQGSRLHGPHELCPTQPTQGLRATLQPLLRPSCSLALWGDLMAMSASTDILIHTC